MLSNQILPLVHDYVTSHGQWQPLSNRSPKTKCLGHNKYFEMKIGLMKIEVNNLFNTYFFNYIFIHPFGSCIACMAYMIFSKGLKLLVEWSIGMTGERVSPYFVSIYFGDINVLSFFYLKKYMKNRFLPSFICMLIFERLKYSSKYKKFR